MTSLEFQADSTHDVCVQLLESLGRVASSVNSGLDLGAVLQAVVDAICDHTDWQICWISAVDYALNRSEVVARRDRLDYSTAAEIAWPLDGLPAMKAIQSRAPILIEDAQSCQDFPAYAADARARGYVCGVVLPLDCPDTAGRPVVLSVQSKLPLLPDDRQIHFLRTVAKVATLAIKTANLDVTSRRMLADVSQAITTHTSVVDATSNGSEAWAAFDLVQRSQDHSMLVLDRNGKPLYCERSPLRGTVSDAEWKEQVREHAAVFADPSLQSQDVSPFSEISLPWIDDNSRAYVRSEPIGDPELLGTLVLISGTRPPLGFDHALALTRSSVAVALVRDFVRFSTEVELGESAIESLLHGSSGRPEQLLLRASYVGIDLHKPFWLIAAGLTGRDGTEVEAASISGLEKALSPRIEKIAGAKVVSTTSGVAILVPGAVTAERLQQVLTAACDQATARTGGTVTLAIAGTCNEVEDYPKAWQDATVALDLAVRLGRAGVVGMTDFGAYRFLLSATDHTEIDSFIESALGRLIEYDDKFGTDLTSTTEQFVASGGRFQDTARGLNVHVSTLRYRLARIEELLGVNMSSPDTRFELTLAARLHALRQQ